MHFLVKLIFPPWIINYCIVQDELNLNISYCLMAVLNKEPKHVAVIVTCLITLGGQNRPCLYSASQNAGLFIYFLSLHHPNNRSENNSMLLSSPLQLNSQKIFFGIKNTGGDFVPSPANLSFAYTYSIT
jgi:hypothetical protein